MTDKEINDACASIVMGWKQKVIWEGGIGLPQWCVGDKPAQRIDGWNPAESLEQAKILLDKMRVREHVVIIEKTHRGPWTVSLDGIGVGTDPENLARAICKACLEMHGVSA